MSNDDERNVDEQIDEEQRRLEQQRSRPLIQNRQNNTRTDIDESTRGVVEAVDADAVTNPNASEPEPPS